MSQPLPRSTIEHELKRTLAYRQVSAELRIAYDDMHGLWGGSRLTVQGDGRVERQVRPRGASTPTRTVKQIDVPELLELVRLLVELAAWEQRTPEREPIPDESRAELTIRINDTTSQVWERSNEMLANNRLLRVKNWIKDQFRDDK